MSSRVWRDGQLIASDFELDALDRYLADPNVLVWFDLCEPTPELLDRLAGELNFSSHAVEDALAPRPADRRAGLRIEGSGDPRVGVHGAQRVDHGPHR